MVSQIVCVFSLSLSFLTLSFLEREGSSQVLLKRSVETRCGASGPAGLPSWLATEERAAEVMRDAYRFAWNLPGTRETLASR